MSPPIGEELPDFIVITETALVGHVFFRFGTSGLQELVEAEEFAAEGAIGYATHFMASFLRFLAQSRR